jgi:hypothetical protein
MTFNVDISKFVEKCGTKADQVVRKICLDLTSSIILKTPVDTGRARANWQTTLGAPATGTVASTDKGGAASITAASNAASKAKGNVFWITNNLPYIAVLEYGLYGEGPNTIGGFSKQAPNGMVRISIRELERALR